MMRRMKKLKLLSVKLRLTSDEDDDEDDDEVEDDKPLQTETADENAKIIEEYTPNDEDNWIQRNLNKNYKIMPSNNEKSLFEAVKQSFDDESTSVSQIREYQNILRSMSF